MALGRNCELARVASVSVPCLLSRVAPETVIAELAVESIAHVDGVVAIPQGPGLGIEINRDLLARYAA